MELALIITVGVLFTLLGLVSVASVVVGLPGAWIIIGGAIAIELLDGLYLSAGRQTFSWWLIAVCVVLATVGEILEFVAGALGAKKAGSTRRGVFGALIGGVIGAIGGLFIPLPLLGSLVGAVVGTFAGAMIGELTAHDVTVAGSIKPATGASIGRILGTLSKVPIAIAIWLALSVAAFIP